MMARLMRVLALVSGFCACFGVAPVAASASRQFGISHFTMGAVDAAGEAFTQAGGHPYEVTGLIELTTQEDSMTHQPIPVEDVKSLFVGLPAGLIGDPQAAAQCPVGVFNRGGSPCSTAAQIGTFLLVVNPNGSGLESFEGDVYNLVPEAGRPAEFGLATPFGANLVLSADVNSGGDYNVLVGEEGIQMLGVDSISVKFWGVPGLSLIHISEPTRL